MAFLCLQNAPFWSSERVILTTFRVKKPVRTFWKLFWSWLEVVYTLFFAFKGTLSSVFSAQKVDKLPLKSKYEVKIWPSDKVILTIVGVKKGAFCRPQKSQKLGIWEENFQYGAANSEKKKFWKKKNHLIIPPFQLNKP